MDRYNGTPSCCTFCGKPPLVRNGITGIIVFACHTHWDSQRGGRWGLWKQSRECEAIAKEQAAEAKGGQHAN